MTFAQWPPPPDPERDRRARRSARRGVIAANLLLLTIAAILIAFVVWRPTSLANPGTNSGTSGQSGFGTTGPTGTSAPTGPTDAAAIARAVDGGLVDINTTLSYVDEAAAGTGMVLTPGGRILTNNHVIEGATSISVTDVGNGQTYGAHVVGYDRHRDIAVLQLVGAAQLRTVRLGDSSKVRLGQAVVGVGNAGGAGGTPSFAGGAVTALNHSINANDAGDGTTEQLTGLIATDAAIQPGDSGGPLVDTSGQVIGIDTAASNSFQFQGSTTQGFSIPINTALDIARQITANQSSTTVHIGPTPFLGVQVTAPGSTGNSFGFGNTGTSPAIAGAQIANIVPGSPAAISGLAPDDTITDLGGQPVSSPNSLSTVILKRKPGDQVAVVYLDPAGTRHVLRLRLAAGPPQ